MAKNNMDNVDKAAKLYIARRRYIEHPDGYQDDNGAWKLAASERRACCKNVTSRYLFNSHARSIEHVANLFGVSSYDVSKALSKFINK